MEGFTVCPSAEVLKIYPLSLTLHQMVYYPAAQRRKFLHGESPSCICFLMTTLKLVFNWGK